MKKIILVMMFCVCSSVCARNYSVIDGMEKSLFGMTYPEQDNKTRIERLEKNIYGATQSGNIDQRISKLSTDLSADLIGKEIAPKKDTFEDYEEEISPDNSVDYPIINELEKTVYNKEFKNKEIKQRLSNLEKSLFKKTYDNEDLSTRTDRLKNSLRVKTIQEENDYTDFANSYDYQAKMPSRYEDFEYSTPKYSDKSYKKYDVKVVKILNALEKKILNRTYANQNEEERLERLEEAMFSTSFPQDSMEIRLERLASAWQATKTSKKYDSNKFSQHMATAMQVGAFLLMILAMVL